MAIYTKHDQRILKESIRVDGDCFYSGEIVKVWALAEGESTERLYWFSDLRGDNKHEVRDVIASNSKKGRATK